MYPDTNHLRLAEPTDAQIADYRSISGWAVAGLILGLISPLALVDPLVWAVPVAAILVCGWAFIQIKQNTPAMIGRKAALAGLWLAVFSLTAASGDWLYFRWCIRGEASQVAMYWFQLLAKNQPEYAFQLTLPPLQRQPFDERIWDFYNDTDMWRKALKDYVAPGKTEEPPQLVHTLLALGDSAQVRYVKTLNQFYIGPENVLDQLYAVTLVDAGEKKTFFVNMRLSRITLNNGRADWRIVGAQGGVDANGNATS